MCPVIFEDFCKLKDVFQRVVKMSLSFEFRMSQLLLSPLAKGWNQGPSKDYIPWVPSNEKAFMKPQTAATLGYEEGQSDGGCWGGWGWRGLKSVKGSNRQRNSNLLMFQDASP